MAAEIKADPNETPSTTTIGPVHNATIPISHSETPATDARHLDQVAAVAAVNGAEAAPPMAVNATTGVKVAAGTGTIVVTVVATDGHRTADSVAEGAEASGTVGDETAATVDKVAHKAAVATAHVVNAAPNAVAHLMVTSEEPKASVPAMHTTVHLEISERHVHLNEKKTERT